MASNGKKKTSIWPRSFGWRVPRYDLKACIFYNLSTHFLVDYACLLAIMKIYLPSTKKSVYMGHSKDCAGLNEQQVTSVCK